MRQIGDHFTGTFASLVGSLDLHYSSGKITRTRTQSTANRDLYLTLINMIIYMKIILIAVGFFCFCFFFFLMIAVFRTTNGENGCTRSSEK